MINKNSAYIHFFTVNFSGQGEIRRPSAEKGFEHHTKYRKSGIYTEQGE
jgi:hypothetical protein